MGPSPGSFPHPCEAGQRTPFPGQSAGGRPMADETSFRDLIRRVRARDETAAAELVRRYESVVRSFVRVRLRDPGLRRLFDSMDICQAVLGSFFARTALGQYELDSPDHLQKVLVVIARNKLAAEARKRRPDVRGAAPIEEADAVAPGPDDRQRLAARDLLEEVRRRLPEHARRLADLRAEGLLWPEIAVRLGGKPEALRKVLDRAVGRVARDLRLEGGEP